MAIHIRSYLYVINIVAKIGAYKGKWSYVNAFIDHQNHIVTNNMFDHMDITLNKISGKLMKI